MEKLLELLRDGKSRSLEMIAMELDMTLAQVKRDIEFLERSGLIRKVDFSAGGSSCSGCTSCSSGGEATCHGCMPEGGFQNMGSMWEVVYEN